MSMFLSSQTGKKAQPPPQHSLAQEKVPHAPVMHCSDFHYKPVQQP